MRDVSLQYRCSNVDGISSASSEREECSSSSDNSVRCCLFITFNNASLIRFPKGTQTVGDVLTYADSPGRKYKATKPGSVCPVS